jgi:hypothetical protein
MPEDGLDFYYGSTCVKCGNEPRAHGRRWGEQCLDASRKWQEAYVATVAAEEMAYVSPERRPFLTPTPPPPPPAGPAPAAVCRHCSANSGWVDGGASRWVCAICGWPA